MRIESSRVGCVSMSKVANLAESTRSEIVEYLSNALGGLRDKHNCKLEEGNETIIFLEKLEHEILEDERKIQNREQVAQSESWALLNHVVEEKNDEQNIRALRV